MARADLAILVVVGLSALWGLWRGFLYSTLDLASWIFAIVLAWKVSPWLVALVGSRVASISPFVARVVIFFLLVLLVRLLTAFVIHALHERLDERSRLRSLDHFMGGIFGLARGLLIVIALCLAAHAAGFHARQYAPRSRLLPLLRPWIVRTGRWAGLGA